MTFRLLASPFLVTGVAFTVYYFRTYSRKLVFGSLYFLITILPVLQIVHVGDTMVAERYTYIPMIGVYFIFAVLCQFLFKEKIAKNISAKRFLVAVVSILLFIFACMTHERCKVWKDSISLWSDIIAKFPVAIAYTNRAAAYGYQGDYDDAIEDLNQAIALNPKYSVTYFNRGAAYKAKGNYKYAIEDFSQAITLNPQDFEAYYRRGISYYYQNDYNHAIEDFTHVIKLNPTYSEVYYNLGIANKAKGDIYRALGDFKKACNLGFDLACKALSGN